MKNYVSSVLSITNELNIVNERKTIVMNIVNKKNLGG